TVTATLNSSTHALTVLADTTKGTTGAQILLQSSSVVVNDVRGTASQQAGSFAVGDVEQIHFQDGSHTLDMDVNNSLISIQHVPLKGVDFNLGANSSVGATAHLALPEVQAETTSGTIDVTGTINTGGHFSLSLQTKPPDKPFATFGGFSLQDGKLSLDDQNG